ncbi:DNA polymerase-3 subunit epsilon [Formosa sp. Hel1_31_208]|uniref:3'-5' exonuclease n=1 Tax=Formosa sp. Hel1_31_208 TaxID=1798225 RepID=UPI00087AA9EB|nr:3'-5' exonuclease [Formosa sp. Hel1_31_208]SDS71748.1 DNA polymerase-3 subunit epsilon [Formosa sp. Hel1_31_208]
MQLNLTKPICFFDLETTGINITNDRIVEISILKVHPNGTEDTYTQRVNPTIPIPPEVTLVHGISDADIADKPTFADISKEVYHLIKDSDLGGFNSNRFDIPLLAEEMLRAGIDFDMKNAQSIDVQTIFHKMEQRTLSAAYKFYCDKNLDDAHSAEADTLATYEVLKAQLDRYEDLENDAKFLADFSSRKRFADFAGFIAYNKDEQECFSFGKHKGKLVTDVLENEPGYFGWLLNADFPLYTKKVLTAIKLRAFNNKLS